MNTYVRREKLATWHVNESTISGAAITNCGRRLEPNSSERGGLVYTTADFIEPLCLLCQGPVPK